jgi:hypothetical protein
MDVASAIAAFIWSAKPSERATRLASTSSTVPSLRVIFSLKSDFRCRIQTIKMLPTTVGPPAAKNGPIIPPTTVPIPANMRVPTTAPVSLSPPTLSGGGSAPGPSSMDTASSSALVNSYRLTFRLASVSSTVPSQRVIFTAKWESRLSMPSSGVRSGLVMLTSVTTRCELPVSPYRDPMVNSLVNTDRQNGQKRPRS